MKTRKINRLLATFLSLCLMVGMLPMSAFAAETKMCSNHPAHDGACGYVEAVEGRACGHTHDEACGYAEAKEGAPCKHEQGEHDESCGYMEGAEEIPCDKECSETGGDGAIVHAEGCAYTPAVEGACSHEKHDGNCGFAEAVVGAECWHEHKMNDSDAVREDPLGGDTACGYVESVESHACGHTCELCNGAETANVLLVGEKAAATVPGAPQDFTATPGSESVDLVWVAPASNGGAEITKYEVSKDGGVSWVDAGSLVDHSFTGLTNGQSYTFQVRAVNSVGAGTAAETTATPVIMETCVLDGYVKSTGVISGNVYDLPVTLWQNGVQIQSVTTKTNGFYRFTPVVAGDYVIKLGGLTTSGIYYTEINHSITINRNLQRKNFELESSTLPGTYSISGTVNAPEMAKNKYVRGLMVTLWKNGTQIRSTVTGNDGKYTIYSLSPETYTLKTGGPDRNGAYYAEESSLFTINNENVSYSLKLEYTNAPGTNSISGVVQLKEEGKEKLRDIEVTLRQNGRLLHSVKSERNGKYGFYSLTPGTYVVTAGGLDYNDTYYTEQSQTFTITDQNEKCTFRLSPGTPPNTYTLSGNVKLFRSNDSPALPGVSVTLYPGGSSGAIDATTTDHNGDYSFTGVKAGEYTVKAGGPANGMITIEESQNVTITVQDPLSTVFVLYGTPSAPESFTATPQNNQVVLSWAAPQSNGSAEITKYQVSKDGGTSWSDAASATAHTFAGLTNGQSYTFQVRAVSSVGAGPGASTTAVPMAPGPGAPQNFDISYANTILNLYWKVPTSDGGLPIVKYQYSVTKDGEPDNWKDIPGSNASTTTYTVTGLTNFTNYTVKLRAVNSTSVGEAVSDTFYLQPSRPGAPRNLTATPGDGQMTLIWETPENNGGSPITHYQYRYNADPASSGAANQWSRIPDSGPNTVSFTITGLENGVELAFFVRAYSDYGMGDHAMVMATPQVASANLTGITSPAAITGIGNGTLLTAIGLPDKVEITTTEGNKQADVTWNRNTATYDPESREEQTFTISGSITLPDGVTNTDGIPLTVQVSVTVAAGDADVITGIQITKEPDKTAYTEGEALDLAGITVSLDFSKTGKKTVSLDEFAANNITASPADGAKLSISDTTVTVSSGGKSDSFGITVEPMQQAETPVFSPPGREYNSPQEVEITCSTINAIIYYTTDGTLPTAASTPYTGKIRVEQDMTLKAIAVRVGMKVSEVAEAVYTITGQSHTHTLTHVPAKPATCADKGHTQYWYCEGCRTYFGDSRGTKEIELSSTVIPATGEHTGGMANCHEKAICKVCGASYGALAPDNHDGVTEIRNKKEATKTEEGYTGDIYCLGCGAKTATGAVIPKLEPEHTHSFGSEWHSDGSYHWQLCTAGDGEAGNKAAHTPSGWIDDGQLKENEVSKQYKECTVCGYLLDTVTTVKAEGTDTIKPGKDGGWKFHSDFKTLKTLRLNSEELKITFQSDTLAYLTYPGYEGIAGIAKAGSVEVMMYKEFLETLPSGTYTLEVESVSGETNSVGSASFTVANDNKPVPDPDNPTPTPDPDNPTPTPDPDNPTPTPDPDNPTPKPGTDNPTPEPGTNDSTPEPGTNDPKPKSGTNAPIPVIGTNAPASKAVPQSVSRSTLRTDVPATGDENNLWWWVVVLLASLAGGSAVLVFREKKGEGK